MVIVEERGWTRREGWEGKKEYRRREGRGRRKTGEGRGGEEKLKTFTKEERLKHLFKLF